jgi:hypothetical protein
MDRFGFQYRDKMGKQIAISHQVKLAEDHWEWLEEILHKIYVDAMLHGYKHGFDEGYEYGVNE